MINRRKKSIKTRYYSWLASKKWSNVWYVGSEDVRDKNDRFRIKATIYRYTSPGMLYNRIPKHIHLKLQERINILPRSFYLDKSLNLHTSAHRRLYENIRTYLQRKLDYLAGYRGNSHDYVIEVRNK